ncbi:hypothetical protein A8M60_10830 [Nocardia farcinica]|nr:hypothetical protein A8M60_10830 [Nocardia farcinica]
MTAASGPRFGAHRDDRQLHERPGGASDGVRRRCDELTVVAGKAPIRGEGRLRGHLEVVAGVEVRHARERTTADDVDTVDADHHQERVQVRRGEVEPGGL